MTHDTAAFLRWAVSFGRLAPSVHNTQPWRFAVGDDAVTVYADAGRRLDVLDPAGRQLVISCGAAVENIDLAMRVAGTLPSVDLVPSGPLLTRLATLRPGVDHVPSALERMLFDAIPHRATNRHALDGSRVAPEVLDGLRRVLDGHDVGIEYVDDVAAHAAIASLTTVADRVQAASPTMRAELRRWARVDDSSPDGVPYSNRGLGAPGSRRLNPPVRDFDVDGRAARAAAGPDPTVDRPVLAALWTERDRPGDWVRTGMAVQRVLLALTAGGLAASFVNQPVDDPSLRPVVADQLGVDGVVQVMLRIGIGIPVQQAPRRPVDDVLVAAAPLVP